MSRAVSPSVPSPARRTAPLALVLAAGLAGACSVQSSDGAATGGRGESGGEVAAAAAWSPATPTTVAGVPVAAVREGIEARLAQARPDPLAADQWRHVRTLYQRFGQGPLWLDGDGLAKERATALLRALVSADRDALRLDAYPLVELAGLMERLNAGGKPTAEQLADADVLLSSAFAALGEDLLTGQVDPKAVSQDWHIDPEEEAVDSALVRSLGERQLDRGLARMRPADPDYEALRKALVEYRALAAKGWARVPEGRALRPGEPDRAARLQALRDRLGAEGLLAGGDAGAAVPAAGAVPGPDAIGSDARAAAARRRRAAPRAARAGEAVYDAALAGAVATYQARHGIVVDSVLGAETVRSMNLSPAYRLGQIAANLERWRWMPRDLGHRHVFVNVPAFRLEAYEGGRKALEMRVIVGEEYEGRRTAVFSDTMTTVVFRPYWNLTDDIMDEEVWPKVRADPGYLAEHRMETYQEAGRTRIRQLPGDSNSLGLVKFLFPNDFNIYLHDTPQRDLFGKDVRAFSHGCIRLEKPAEFARWVLGWSADSVQRAMTTAPDNKTVRVPRRLPVYITYFTAYLQDGRLRFGNDLYDRDAAMVKAIATEGGQRPETVRAVEALRKLVAE